MSIRVIPHPATLSWSLFTAVDSLPDDEVADTMIRFSTAHGKPKQSGGAFVFAHGMTLNVSPAVRVLRGADHTAALLAHEQGHYNIGILVARAMAREMDDLSEASVAALGSAMTAVFDNHRLTLMPPIQESYDSATSHGTDAGEQARWSGLIAAALALPAADTLDGNDL